MADNTIKAALQRLREQRSQIDQAIAALEQLGGVSSGATGPQASISSPSRLSTSQPSGGPLTVHPGEFFSLSVTKAASLILKRAGHPLKTAEIVGALRRAEFPLKGKAPDSNVYTSLTRSKDFVKVLPNTWALSEWHPDLAAGSDSKPSQKKRRGRGAAKRGPGRPRKKQTLSLTNGAESEQTGKVLN